MLRLSDVREGLRRLLDAPVIQHGAEVQIPPPTYRWREPDSKLRMAGKVERTIRVVVWRTMR